MANEFTNAIVQNVNHVAGTGSVLYTTLAGKTLSLIHI